MTTTTRPRQRMHRKTREALDELREFKWAYLTNGETLIDERKDGDVLLVNNGTAAAMVRRGLATFVDSDDADREADILSIVEMPDESPT